MAKAAVPRPPRAPLLLLLLLLRAASAAPPAALTHGWATAADMLAAHGGNGTVLPDEQLAYLAAHYKWVTFADCYGSRSGLTQEAATLASAAALKKIAPAVKVVFYWKSDMSSQVAGCSSANATWAAHPEWQLKDDSGKVVTNGNAPVFDSTVASFRAFWSGHLVELAKETGSGGGAPLLDGMFIDGCQDNNVTVWKNVNPGRTAAIVAATQEMVAETQRQLDALGFGQVLIWNALDTEFQLEEHAAASGASMADHYGALQFIDARNASWVPERMLGMLALLQDPRNADRMVQVKTWPGPLIHPREWVNNSQPTTDDGLRAMTAAELEISLASFLIVAEANLFFVYSWFWGFDDYIPFGLHYTVPTAFYPALSCPLGAPEAPFARDGLVLTRSFAHADVRVDLGNRTNSRIDWRGCAAAAPRGG